MSKQPKIEVRNLKHAAFASEETHCFEATVYVDGKKFCRASNEGRGGADLYEPLKREQGGTKKLHERIEQIGQRLPQTDLSDIGLEGMSDYDGRTRFEIAVGHAVNNALIARDIKRDFRRKVLFVDPSFSGVRFIKPKNKSNIEKAKEVACERYPNATILNGKDDDEIVRLVRQAEGE